MNETIVWIEQRVRTEPMKETRTRGRLAAWVGHFLPLTAPDSPRSYFSISV